MRKLICFCIALLVLCMLGPHSLAGEAVSLPANTLVNFSGELPEALRRAFSGPEWEGWAVEVGQWFRREDSAVYVRMVMEKEGDRALCAMRLIEGRAENVAIGKAALYPGRKPSLEAFCPPSTSPRPPTCTAPSSPTPTRATA